ncbi:MAG: hypothetical protein HY507_01125 [Candidatus Zambryskibacteria bacterium]|nr:hypothetical protein [Candidatus Zambryskibacteria bacterium]
MKVKMFIGSFEPLEPVINQWLGENGEIKIHHIAQSQSGQGLEHFLTFSIWYTLKNDQKPAPLL